MSIERFWAKVRRGKPDDCWPWTGFKKPSGHGLTSLQGFTIHASRKAWILTHGPVRGELCVLHRCDNALCCNPAHLYLGTRADNMFDRFGNDERTQRGRPFLLTQDQLEELWRMRREGAKLKDCASKFGVHIATVCRYINEVRRAKLEKNRADRLARVA